MVLTATVDEVKKTLLELDVQSNALRQEIEAIKQTTQDVKESVAELKEMLGALQASLLTQCSCGRGAASPVAASTPDPWNVAAMPAVVSNLPAATSNALVPLPAAGSRDDPWGSQWANWQSWNGSDWAKWQHKDEESSPREEPFDKPYWIKEFDCLYQDKECDEGTQAQYYVRFKSKNHRKNEVLCRQCVINHRPELNGVMKIRR